MVLEIFSGFSLFQSSNRYIYLIEKCKFSLLKNINLIFAFCNL